MYGEVKENDSHFAFLSQVYEVPRNFYGAGGTYTLIENVYTEKLTHTAWDDYRGKNFPFTVEITKDSLIQHGVEEIKEKNIKRYVVEKYIRIK